MKVEPVKPGDLAWFIGTKHPTWRMILPPCLIVGEEVISVRGNICHRCHDPETKRLIVDFDGDAPVFRKTELVKISPDAGQFEKEAERETKRPARVTAPG